MPQYTRDGLTFDYRDQAPAEGVEPAGTVVLLHGYPQDSSVWDAVVPTLNAAGLRTLAPDLRGYSPGARPTDRAAYRMREIADDVAALLDATGVEQAHIAGHDWGGAAAWASAGFHRERALSLTAFSTPHPAALNWSLAHSSQGLKSWYMGFFQLPKVPEAVVSRDMSGQLQRTGLPKQFADRYAERLADPAALAGALAWYRAIPASRHDPIGKTRVPTTYAWGRRDFALGRAAAHKTADFVDAAYLFVDLDAGHWLPEKHPDEVASLILDRATSI